MITSLIAFLLRFVVILALTYAFVVLYEHGPNGFADHVTTEYRLLLAEFSSSRGT